MGRAKVKRNFHNYANGHSRCGIGVGVAKFLSQVSVLSFDEVLAEGRYEKEIEDSSGDELKPIPFDGLNNSNMAELHGRGPTSQLMSESDVGNVVCSDVAM